MSGKNLRSLVRLTINHGVVGMSVGSIKDVDHIAVNPLHIVEVWPDIYHGVCRGSVVYLRGRPKHLGDSIYVTERLATVERRVREALGGRGMSVRHTIYRAGHRNPGSVTGFMRRYKRAVLRDETVAVPCGGCNACCRSPRLKVEVQPDELRRHPDAYREADGTWRLPKNEDGTCVYLIDGKCSIYDDRPFVCRTYDCRWALITGYLDRDDPVMDAAIKEWAQFKMPTSEDRETFLAIRLAIMDGGLPETCEGALAKATRWARYTRPAKRLLAQLAALPPEQLERLTCFAFGGAK